MDRKKLKIICWATPFIVFALSISLAYVFHEDPTTWEDNLVIKEVSNPFEYQIILNAILSSSLFAIFFHLFKRIRESLILSFLIFFWSILAISVFYTILSGSPITGIIVLMWSGGLPFMFVSVLYFIVFRICVNRVELRMK